MKLHYYPETDSLYIELSASAGAETRELADGVNVESRSVSSVNYEQLRRLGGVCGAARRAGRPGLPECD